MPPALSYPPARTPAPWSNDGLDGRLESNIDLPLDALKVSVNPEEGTSCALPRPNALCKRVGLPKRQSQALREFGAQEETREECDRDSALEALAASWKLRGPNPSDHVVKRLWPEAKDHCGCG